MKDTQYAAMPNVPVLAVQGMVKNYKTVQALKGVSFSVPKGSVYGILGPNGSGKTTLLGIVMDVLNQTQGTYQWFGNPHSSEDMRKNIGTLLETPNFYHYLNAVDNLKIAAHIKGKGEEDIDKVLETVNLHQRKMSKFSTYSLGMKQRLAIASALLGNPEVLVFDEPTNGLDPQGIVEIRELIKNLHQQGKTIIMASHVLDEVEKVCSHVAILKYGTLLLDGEVNAVLKGEDTVMVKASDVNRLGNLMQQYQGVSNVEYIDGVFHVMLPNGATQLANINAYCFNNGITLELLQAKKKSLEAAFMEITN
jgi:ABC-type multidrug transport system ATPase subunit